MPPPPPLPHFVVVAGCSGTGKSTVGAALAARLGREFVDGDDFHSAEHRQKMAAGIGLNDDDRLPWLQRLAQFGEDGEKPVVLACSALKATYRRLLLGDHSAANSRIFILTADRKVLEHRLATRYGHYAKVSLLDSQLEDLELPADPAAEPNVFVVDVNRSVPEIVEHIVSLLTPPP